jgi:hypothetical protein
MSPQRTLRPAAREAALKLARLWTPAREFLRQHYVARMGNCEARLRRQMLARAPAALRPALHRLRQGCGTLPAPTPESSPVFIFAASWRSGSTWLQRLVMTAREIIVWGEPFDRSGIVQKLARQLLPFAGDWPTTDRFAQVDAPNLADRWVASFYPPMPSLLEAHRAFLCALFEMPARQRGFDRWGFKETRLDTEHATYLQLLFPGARFLFLVRNPMDAFESYRTWGYWYDEWPSVVATPREFGRMWARLAADFLAHHDEVGGLLLRYEDLVTGAVDVRAVARHLALDLSPGAAARCISGRRRPKPALPRVDRKLLRREVDEVASRLGYRLD